MKKKTSTLQVMMLVGGLLATGIAGKTEGAESATPEMTFLRVATSVMDGHALYGATGAVGLNQAAGDFNQQYNGGSVAVGNHASAQAHVSSRQLTRAYAARAPDVSLTMIDGEAFASTRGLIRVNQSAGVGNAQVNAAAIAFGLNAEVHSSAELQQQQAPTNVQAATVSGRREAIVGETAFQGVKGVTQVNQAAGSGNATANVFTFGVELGHGP